MPISHKALNLIESILQERELRLCCKIYTVNDFKLTQRTPGNLIAVRADKLAPDYQGRHVYANDAADIKAHVFFRGIQWERLHQLKPPFVPKVKGWEDTRYFEEDEPISDVDDASSYSSAKELADDAAALDRPDAEWSARHALMLEGLESADAAKIKAALKAKQRMERKRPRDKMLRDKEVGKQVLNLRKKGAFLGYTYRRPRGKKEDRVGRAALRTGQVPPAV